MGDNSRFDITHEGKEAFDLAVQLAFYCHGFQKITHYLDSPEKGLILFWNSEREAIKLPYSLNKDQVISFIWGWLENQTDDNRQQKLDHDGSNGRGWRLYNEKWGFVGDYRYACMAIQPVWIWYGK